MAFAQLAAALGIGLAAASAAAGPLLSATLDQTFRVGSSEANVISVHVSAVDPSGSLSGNVFSLDAGSAFATSTVRPIALPPVTRATVVLRRNGQLVGTLGEATLTPATGISGFEQLRAKIGKAPPFTLLDLPLSIGAGRDVRIPPPTPNASPTLVISYFGDAWHLGAVTQTGLTGGAPPTVRATGGVSVTPSGQTHIQLVSLSRIRVHGLVTFTSTTLGRLTLVYAPEPSRLALALAGAGALSCAALARRRRAAE